jgi:hypothetical protein
VIPLRLIPVSFPIRWWFAVVLGATVACAATAKTHEETVFLFENRKVEIAVPDGFGIASSKDDNGLMTVRVADRKEKVSLQITFAPDPESRFAAERDRKERMVALFHDYVESSVEKAMQFEELGPRIGAGTFCIFTDASLAGKAKPPPGEFLNYTAGLKAWPGVVAIFTLFSNDTKSKEYLGLMEVMRDSVQEQPAPLR